MRQTLPILLTLCSANAQSLVLDNTNKTYTEKQSFGSNAAYSSFELKNRATADISNTLSLQDGQLSLNNSTLSLIALDVADGNIELTNGSVLRIYPSEYSDSDIGKDVALHKSVTDTTSRAANKGFQMVTGNLYNQWKSLANTDKYPAYARIDLGKDYMVNRWRVSHHGARSSNETDQNTKGYRLQYSTQSNPGLNTDSHWKNLDVLTDNAASITDRLFEPTKTRYLRMVVDVPTQNNKSGEELKVQLLEVYSSYPNGYPDWYSSSDRVNFSGTFTADSSSKLELIYPKNSTLPKFVRPFCTEQEAAKTNVYIGRESDSNLTKMEYAYRRWIIPGQFSDLYDPQGGTDYVISDNTSSSDELWTQNGNNSVKYTGGTHVVDTVINIGGSNGDSSNHLVLNGANLTVSGQEVSLGGSAGQNTITVENDSTLDGGHYVWVGNNSSGNQISVNNSTLKASKVLVGDGNTLSLTNGSKLILDAYSETMDSSLGHSWANNSAYLDIRGDFKIESGSAIYLSYPSEDALPLAVNLLHYESTSAAYDLLQQTPVYAFCAQTGKQVTLEYNKGFWVQPGMLPANFELPFKETGKTEVSYMAEDAFSPERLEDGRKIYQEMCARCHVNSGKDMPMFGAAFGDVRVVSSTKKFAGALGDPEAGEKVYEFLRYNHPGPFQQFGDAFLQPGPLALKPGSINPVLNTNHDFFTAWTGYTYPTIEDVHFDLNDYNRTQMLTNKKRLSWMEWMPHSVPPAISDDAVKAHIASNGTSPSSLHGAAELNRWFWRDRYGYEEVRSAVKQDGWSYDGIVMAQYAQGSWIAMQSYEHHLPDWVDGKWSKPGNWQFELDSAVNVEIHQHGVRNKHNDVEGNSRRKEWFARMKHGWWDFSSGIAPNRDASKGTAYGPWGCWLGTYGQSMKFFHSMTLKYFTYNKAVAEYANKGTKSRDNRDLHAYEPKYNEDNWRVSYHQHAPFIEHANYLDWKYYLGQGGGSSGGYDCMACEGQDSKCSYCGGDGYLADNVYHSTCGGCGGGGCSSCDGRGFNVNSGVAPAGHADLYQMSVEYGTEREQRFRRAFVQRHNRDASWGGALTSPVVLCRGTEHVGVGDEYTLFIMRMQGQDGDISITASDLPNGARLVSQNDGFKIKDYYVKWTPTASDIGNHTFKIKASSSQYSGTDTQTVTLKVSQLGPEPTLDPIDEIQTVRIGQYLTMPFSVNSDYRKKMEFEMVGNVGMAFQNHRKRGGIYYIKPDESDLGVHKLTFIARDEHGRENKQTMMLEVLPNSAPKISFVEMGQGPGAFKNIFRGKAGEEIRMRIAISDPEGDEIKISTSHGYPGKIEKKSDGTYEFVITVTDDMAEHFRGPNVFTVVAQDHWGAEGHLVTLVYFEPRGSNDNNHPWAVTPSVQYVYGGEKVYLDGSASDDPDGDAISYQWDQVSKSGVPNVSLTSRKQVVASFTAPSVSEQKILKFTLQVTDSKGATDYNVARVVVLPGERPRIPVSQLANLNTYSDSQASDYKMVTGVAAMIYEAEDAWLDGVSVTKYSGASGGEVAQIANWESGSILWHVPAEEAGNYSVRVNVQKANASENASGRIKMMVNGKLVGTFNPFDKQGPFTEIGAKNYGASIGAIYTIAASQGSSYIQQAPLVAGVNKIELLVENTNNKTWGVDNMMVYCAPSNEYESVVIEDSVGGTLPPLAAIPDGAVYLSDLSWSSKNGDMWTDKVNGAALVYGKHTYKKGLGFRVDAEVSYKLNGNYSLFSADTFVPAAGNRTIYFEFYADNKKVFSSVQSPSQNPTNCLLDVSGVTTLKIVCYLKSGTKPSGYAVVGDAFLLKPSDYHDWFISQGGIENLPAALRFAYKQANITYKRYAFGDRNSKIKGNGKGQLEFEYDYRPGLDYQMEISSDLNHWMPWEPDSGSVTEIGGNGDYKTRKLLFSSEENEKLFLRVSTED